MSAFTHYHVFELTGPDCWREVKNPDLGSGRWPAKTNFAATQAARKMSDQTPTVIDPDDETPFMAIAQHRVRIFPQDLTDTREFDS